VNALEELLAERIHREGPIPFDAFVDLALYADEGFFGRGRGAGRAGRDFVTSPEVGQLYGALVARAVDGWWRDLGEPDPFLLVDAGAGRGRLAADVLAAAPACAPALRLVLVERSPALREAQHNLIDLEPFEDALGPATRAYDDDDDLVHTPVAGMGPIATSLAEFPAVRTTGVVFANELLDNLPFRVVERAADGWIEVRVGHDGDAFVEVLIPAAPELSAEAELVACGAAPVGARLPVPSSAREWFHACSEALGHGVLAVVDYAATAEELVTRGEHGWLRTYREHERGTSPLVAPGEQDITIDLPVEYVVHAATRAGFTLVHDTTQAEWLRSLGIDELVDDARVAWQARAHIGDLEALRHRSRVSEADALLDPGGLGAHRVLVYRI
jgi:NADH dehydrogenase [ubiquinone] 1 alpha subcomplex assembly factor 7